LSLNIQVYPNPAQDKIYLTSLGFNGMARLQITTVTGQSVQQQNVRLGNEATEISISHLPKGIYLLRLQTEQQSFIQKVIKQ
jgi:hypothetical protein